MARAPQLFTSAPAQVRTLSSTLSVFRAGQRDPTTVLTPGQMWRATFTPDGPGTIHLDWRSGVVAAHAWGPGADWLLDGVPALTGALDPGHRFERADEVVLRAQRHHPDLRFGASRTLYHDLLPVILAQRVTTGEALRQWRDLARLLGAPAPGPAEVASVLRLPPSPEDLVGRPAWWYHRLGIESKRAETLRTVGRHAHHLHGWAGDEGLAARLRLLPGVGEWTVGTVLSSADGDPDAVAVGDYHLKHVVVHAFTGRPRGTDSEMLDLLAPYDGQRGRVVRLLLADGHSAPKFGPRQRVVGLGAR